MKKYYLLGLISGFILGVFTTSFVLRKYYVFSGPTESWVSLDGLKEDLKIEDFVEVNELLGDAPEGRNAYVYPRSSSSYCIVYLPRENKHLDRVESEKIYEIINERMRN